MIRKIYNTIIGLLVFIGYAAVMSIPILFLWNWLMPQIFNLPKIDWLQATGLNILCSLLFKKGNTQSPLIIKPQIQDENTIHNP